MEGEGGVSVVEEGPVIDEIGLSAVVAVGREELEIQLQMNGKSVAGFVESESLKHCSLLDLLLGHGWMLATEMPLRPVEKPILGQLQPGCLDST